MTHRMTKKLAFAASVAFAAFTVAIAPTTNAEFNNSDTGNIGVTTKSDWPEETQSVVPEIKPIAPSEAPSQTSEIPPAAEMPSQLPVPEQAPPEEDIIEPTPVVEPTMESTEEAGEQQ